MQEILSWGQENGKQILETFQFHGDWTGWARVLLARSFMDFENIEISLDQEVQGVYSSGVIADILIKIAGERDVAIKLICETFPYGKEAVPDPDIWKAIYQAYDDMKDVDLQVARPLVLGIVISNPATDNALINLCDRSLFNHALLYSAKTGLTVYLFYRWL